MALLPGVDGQRGSRGLRGAPGSLWRLYQALPPSLRGAIERLSWAASLKSRLLEVSPARVLGVISQLEAAGVSVWLAGGWGVDALLGRQTRRHADVDLVVARDDCEASDACLTQMGYDFVVERSVTGAGLPRSRIYRNRSGHRVDLHPVERAPLPDGRAVLDLQAPGSLTTGKIAGAPVGCLSAHVQVRLHAGYPLRDEDRADLGFLEPLI
ncbi:MAG: nucleotidyltransferase domain-containing protein [Acidimicrobiales bacterium]